MPVIDCQTCFGRGWLGKVWSPIRCDRCNGTGRVPDDLFPEDSEELPMTREFHLSDVLSITTGRLVSTRHIDGVYDILNFMTGDNLFTHQLPRAREWARPILLAEHPALAVVDTSGISKETCDRWVAEQTARFGETLTVRAHQEVWQHKDAIAEAEEMVGPEKVIAVQVSDSSELRDPDEEPEQLTSPDTREE